MKIIGFAHLTFTLPISKFPIKDFGWLTYTELENKPEKKLLMISNLDTHNIQLNGTGTEVTYYNVIENNNTNIVLNNILQFNEKNSIVVSSNFTEEVLNFIQRLTYRGLRENRLQLQIKGLAGLRGIELLHSNKGFGFEENLDSIGVTGIAFYVDQINLTSVSKLISEFNVHIYDTFTFDIGANSFNILFIRFGGVIFEFLQRK